MHTRLLIALLALAGALLGAVTAATAQTPLSIVLGTPKVGNEVTFSTDPLAMFPRVTALADGTFVLAWETTEGYLFARHLDATGSFTTGNFLQGISEHRPLTTPLVVQERSGAIMTEFGVLRSEIEASIGLHPVDAHFTDTSDPFLIPKVATTPEVLIDAVPTFQGTVVAYAQRDGPDTHTFLRWYDPDGKPSPTADNRLGNPGTLGSQRDAKLLSSGTDLVYAVYTQFDPATGGTDVRLQDCNPIGCGNAIGVSGPGIQADFSDIAELPDGTVIIVWQSAQGIGIKHMLLNGIVLETAYIGETAGAFLPKVTAFRDGTFLIAWTATVGTEADGSPDLDVFLRRFGIFPQSPGSSTLIIADTGQLVHFAEPGDQGLFAMSMTTLTDGRVVLAYASETGNATNLNELVYRFLELP
jgi:hypothetical protein